MDLGNFFGYLKLSFSTLIDKLIFIFWSDKPTPLTVDTQDLPRLTVPICWRSLCFELGFSDQEIEMCLKDKQNPRRIVLCTLCRYILLEVNSIEFLFAMSSLNGQFLFLDRFDSFNGAQGQTVAFNGFNLSNLIGLAPRCTLSRKRLLIFSIYNILKIISRYFQMNWF